MRSFDSAPIGPFDKLRVRISPADSRSAQVQICPSRPLTPAISNQPSAISLLPSRREHPKGKAVQRSAGRTNKSPARGGREPARADSNLPVPTKFFVHKYALLTGRISSCRPTKHPKGIVQELDFIRICGPLLGGLGYLSCAGRPRRAAHLEPS